MKPEERLLLVADPPLAGLATRMEQAVRSLGYDVRLARVGQVLRPGAAPPEFTLELLSSASAALLVTSRSLSHTDPRRRACREAGVRIASLPGLTAEMLTRLFPPGSAAQIAARTGRAAAALEGADRVRVRTGQGTDIAFSLSGRRIFQDTGIYDSPGRFGNLPAGEISAAPLEAGVNGRVVVDVAFTGLDKVENLDLRIETGRIAAAHGQGARELLGLLSAPRERVLGEFGIGTNPLAVPGPLALEAEKAVGTVHFGFGDNRSFGGTNSAGGHWDAVVRCGAIEVDGRLLELDSF